MDEQPILDRSELLTLTVEIVAAYAGNNAVETARVPDLIGAVFARLTELATDEKSLPETLTPAVPIRRSVTDDYLVCLEDGKKLRMLKRHLMTAYNMTPAEYRARWGLRPDYPMVAQSYSARRRELAKAIGLGRKASPPAPEPAPTKRRARKMSLAF